MTNEQHSRDEVSRRRLLQGTAALAGTAAAGTAGAYPDEVDFLLPAAQNDGQGRTLSLLGLVGGWVGISPSGIDADSNPPLRLIKGEEHEVVWTNGDGSTHNFNITSGSALEDDNEVLQATKSLTEQGASTSITFTPSEDMSEYYCAPHPAQMRGPVELIDPGEVHELRVQVQDGNGEPLGADVFVGDRHAFSQLVARGGQDIEQESPPAIARFDLLENGEYDLEVWTYGHERVTETVTIDGSNKEMTVTLPAIETGNPTKTYALSLEDGQWVGQSPDSIAGQSNPTLELQAGETYAVEWENTIGRLKRGSENKHFEPLPGHNFVIASGGDTNQWNTYVRSDFTDEKGATQTVEFVANEDMGLYLDQSQLDAMGEINVGGQTEETGTTQGEEIEQSEGGNQTDTGGNETTDMGGNETANTSGNESGGGY